MIRNIFSCNGGIFCLLSLLLLFHGRLSGQETYQDLIDKTLTELNAGNPDGAIPFATKAIQLNPKSPEAINLLGNAWLAKNEYRKAMDQYDEAIKLDPNYQYSVFNKGLCYDRLNDLAKAMEYYKMAVKIDPNFAVAYYNIGLLYFNQGEKAYPQALDNFNMAISNNPNDKNSHYYKGRVFNFTGRYDDAIKELSTAISLDSNFTGAYDFRASAYINKEDYQNAIKDYNRAVLLDPRSKYLVRNRGYCYQRLQDEENALRDYNQALKLDPNYGEAYNDIGMIYFGRQYRDTSNIQKAMDAFTQAIRCSPDYKFAYYNIARLQYIRKNYRSAIDNFSYSLHIDSNYTDARYRRGLAYYYQQDYVHAMEDFNRVLRVLPRHEWALYYLGETYLHSKAFVKSVEAFNKVLALNADNVDAAQEKGFAYFYGGKPREALETFDRLIQINSTNLTARNGRGLVYFDQGKYQEAAQDFIFCLPVDPNYGNPYANLVITLLADNQFAAAFTVYNEYKNRKLNGFIDNSKFQFVSTFIQACIYHIRIDSYEKAANLLQTAILEFETFKKLDSYDYTITRKILGNIYAKLGYTMEMRGDLAGAQNQYKQALAIHPMIPEAKTGYVSHVKVPSNPSEIFATNTEVNKGKGKDGPEMIPVLNTGPVPAIYYALLIAEQEYNSEQFTRLKRPVEDATHLKSILVKKYNFDPAHVTLLENADRNAILSSINTLLRDKTENDNILIFYAGHGSFDKNSRGEVIEGYWVPVGASKGHTENYVSGSEMKVALKKTSARHVVVISDACFSGSLTRDAGINEAPGEIQKLYQKNSRQLLASGDLVPVPDNSYFLVTLMKELENNDKPYITVSELWLNIHRVVSNNSDSDPICVPFKDTGDEFGQFVFIKAK